jgi:hypothetical protein
VQLFRYANKLNLTTATLAPSCCRKQDKATANPEATAHAAMAVDAAAGAAADNNDDDDMPLLFRDTLPRNFLSSAAVAALTSFTEDGDAEHIKPESMQTSRRAAAAHRKARQQAASPYSRPGGDKQQRKSKHASAGEAQVLLSMWKI